MTDGRHERADAARNRRAILRATEELLTRRRPEQITIEQVAAAAGVGKGTVFHRFGNRMGLMVALMQERALALREAVQNDPPPLGPGAPPRERLLAFMDAVVEVAGRNKGLLAALGHAVSATPKPEETQRREDHPVYRFWHGHVSALIAAERPDLDAELLAHLLLAGLHSDPVLQLLERGEAARLAESLRALADALLLSPPRP
ncbi:TetR/AcrR family transcriptional regulator [Sphaerisporangium sp. NPDC005288]|uniref:TetR/AcrR family transcriptional regulator n=1 Tax=Sphaerisporangium sp. NPDC005288 TaxID=3155114 RepID=UPI0033B5BBC4